MEVTITFSKIEWDQAFHQDSFNDWARTEALATITELQQNLNNGVDADGAALKEYSKSYKAYLSSLGESTVTDLLRQGDLHRSMQTNYTPDGAEIIFSGSHPRAGVQNAALAQRLYSMGFVGWFEIGKRNMEVLQKSLGEWVDNELKKIEIKEGE